MNAADIGGVSHLFAGMGLGSVSRLVNMSVCFETVYIQCKSVVRRGAT